MRILGILSFFNIYWSNENVSLCTFLLRMLAKQIVFVDVLYIFLFSCVPIFATSMLFKLTPIIVYFLTCRTFANMDLLI